MKHSEMVNHLFLHPEEVEPGIVFHYKELGLGRGRVDLVGVDAEGNLCLVEVKTRKPSISERRKQLKKYYGPLRHIFGLMNVKKKIRLFLATPEGVKNLYDIKPLRSARLGVTEGIPTSREIYGGKLR